MQSAALTLHEDGADLDTVYSWLQRDFPPAEIISHAQLERLLIGGGYKLHLARIQPTGELAGYALTFEPPSPPLAWLDYLAIAPQIRGQGYGATFVDALRTRLASRGKLGLLLEVEPPTGDDPLIRHEQERRIAFYRRAGAVQLAVDYIYPTASGGFPMLLFFRPLAALDRLPASILREMIASVYDAIHGDLPDRHAILATFLGRIHDQPL